MAVGGLLRDSKVEKVAMVAVGEVFGWLEVVCGWKGCAFGAWRDGDGDWIKLSVSYLSGPFVRDDACTCFSESAADSKCGHDRDAFICAMFCDLMNSPFG